MRTVALRFQNGKSKNLFRAGPEWDVGLWRRFRGEALKRGLTTPQALTQAIRRWLAARPAP
jgi:hypothetical protein